MIFGKWLEKETKASSDRERQNLVDYARLTTKQELKEHDKIRLEYLIEWKKTTLYEYDDLYDFQKDEVNEFYGV